MFHQHKLNCVIKTNIITVTRNIMIPLYRGTLMQYYIYYNTNTMVLQYHRIMTLFYHDNVKQ